MIGMMATPINQRKDRLNKINKELEENEETEFKELCKDAGLTWGITKRTVKEYIETLGYKVENGKVVER